MRECASTSEDRPTERLTRRNAPAPARLLAPLLLALALSPGSAWAQQEPGPTVHGGDPAGGHSMTPDRVALPEEDDFRGTPWTEYADFHEDADESEQTRFFMHSRFFGLSLGSGLMGVSGNRGVVYQGGFPSLEVKAHYWFDFNSALDFGFAQTAFFYEDPALGRADIAMFQFGVNYKYYFNTQNVTAGIAFAHPYAVLGFSSYTKRETNFRRNTATDPDTQVAPNLGGGLEFALQNRKLYLAFEGKLHFPRFRDTLSTQFTAVNDLSGVFYSLNANILFTW